MAVKRLIETTVFVDLLRGYVPAREWLDSQPPGESAISVITFAELLAGCRDRREQKTVEDELAFYPVIWDSEATSRLALEWYRAFHLGHGVGFLDSLIGAAAFQHGLVLFTLNDKHFKPLPGLQVEQPY
jgi:predicted nucleic acid-binding protein